MTNKEILEGNKLIAEFMQYNDIDCHECKHSGVCNHLQCGLSTQEKIEQFKFHSSWDWLMPVVEKIEYLYATDYILPRFEINSHICSFSVGYSEFKKYKQWICGCYDSSPEKEKRNTKIEAAYYVCVEFIKWYNS